MINNKHFKTYTIDEKEFIAIIEKLATSNLSVFIFLNYVQQAGIAAIKNLITSQVIECTSFFNT